MEDVKRPVPQNSEAAPTEPALPPAPTDIETVELPTESAGETPTTSTTPPVGGAQAEPTPPQTATDDLAIDPSEPEEPTKADTPAPAASAPQPIKKVHATPVGVIAAAIIFALLLAALAVFTYIKAQNQPQTKASTSSTQAAPKVGATDVQQTATEASNAVDSANNATDFNDADLTDTTLGL